MPKALPPVDVSAKDPTWDCEECLYKHRPGSVCPQPGRWLATDLDVTKKRGRP